MAHAQALVRHVEDGQVGEFRGRAAGRRDFDARRLLAFPLGPPPLFPHQTL